MIIVFGSINLDMYFNANHLPVPGETVICPAYETASGGKGANQALAAARCGAKTALIGCVGDDGPGMRILNVIRRAGVMTSGVAQSDLPTGCAVVVRDQSGENQVIVASGANTDISDDQVPDEILNLSSFILMQMEVTPEENWKLLARAKAKGARTMLNLAPAIHIPEHALKNLDYLIVNEIEARQISKMLKIEVETSAVKLAAALSHKGNLTCILTIGAQGAVAVTKDKKIITVPALKLENVVDTTGAGDAYSGTLAAALHAGLDLTEAMRRASVAGSLTCTKPGAQDSFPYLGEIEEHLPLLGEVKRQ